MQASSTSTAIAKVRALHIPTLVTRTFGHSPAYFFTWLFVFMEYVRPMAMYPQIAVLPWARWTMILALLFCILEGKFSFHVSRGWILLGTYTAVILASSAGAVYPSVSFDNISLWYSWLIAIFIISSAADSEEKLILLFGAFILWNFKMSQSAFRSWASIGFAFRDWGVTGAPGWFTNSGEFGIEMCVFFPMTVYFLIALRPHIAKWKALTLMFIAFTAVVGMIASSSRGALLGGAVVGLWYLWKSPHRVRAFLAVAALSAVTWFLLPSENKARWAAAGEDTTSKLRIQYWKDGIEITNNFPVLGIGYQNWIPYYRAHYNPKGQLPHNYFIEGSAQLGYLGLLVFVALIGYTFIENARTRKLTGPTSSRPNRFVYFMAFGLDGALIGYLASGFFVTVLFYPYMWVNIGFTMALANVASKSSRATQPIRQRAHGTPNHRLHPVKA
jgi:putative inorganic carbon (hco3(-)) transporter